MTCSLTTSGIGLRHPGGGVGTSSRLAGGSLYALSIAGHLGRGLERLELLLEIECGVLVVGEEGLEGDPLLIPPGQDRGWISLAVSDEHADAVVKPIDRHV